jgi:hypothetical protein
LKRRQRQKKIPDPAAKGKKEPGNLILLHLYSRFKLLGKARACPEAAGDGNPLTAQEVSSYCIFIHVLNYLGKRAAAGKLQVMETDCTF